MKYIILILLFSVSLLANWKSDRENLEHVYTINDFRIFYSINGVHAISNLEDTDNDSIPDFIQNLGTQLTYANNIFTNKLNLINPLKNNRYVNKASYIDIHVLKLNNGHNGLAGDAVIKYNYKILDTKYKSLSISISNKLPKANLTPSHELFHLYQNGYTMIKNRWYTEGTARLIEDLFKNTKTISTKLPKNKNELTSVLLNTYSNSSFFKRLDELCTNNFLVSFLYNLQKVEKYIEIKYDMNKYNWSEQEQKNIRNNQYILKAIKNSISNNQCITNEETLSFLKLSVSF